MGLDDIEGVKERYDVKRKPSSIKIPEEAWKAMAHYHPDAINTISIESDKQDRKVLYNLLDTVSKEGSGRGKLVESEREEIEYYKGEIKDYIEEDW